MKCPYCDAGFPKFGEPGDSCQACGGTGRIVAEEAARHYAREARGSQGQAYNARYRRELRLAWMDGWNGARNLWANGTNFEKPLDRAWRAGDRARRES